MPRLYSSLAGFHDELEKIAGITDFVAKNKGMLGAAGALGGYGAAAGATLGGLHSAYKGYRDAKEQGASGGQAALSALGSGVGGASTGALAGGAIGGGLGSALHTLRPQAAEMARKSLSSVDNPLGALGRFGQRQMHGLTGWTPPEGMTSDAIRGGSWKTHQALENASATDRKLIDRLTKEHGVQVAAEEKGLTHLPGIVNALRGPERGEAAKLLAKHTWTNAHPLVKAQLALTPLSIAAAAADKDNPHKGEQVGSAVGNLVGTTVGSALPFSAGMLAMSAGDGIGKRVGKSVDWLRGKSHTDASELATNEGQHVPSQRDVNPAVPEGIR